MKKIGLLMLITVLCSAILSAAEPAGTVLPADVNTGWQCSLADKQAKAGGKLLWTIPAVPDIYGYVPVLSFELEIRENEAKSVHPVLKVHGAPLPEKDRWLCPRLLNRKNAADGGSGLYLFNLDKTLRSAQRPTSITITLNDTHCSFSVKKLKVFLKPDSRSMIPDVPSKEKNVFRLEQGNPLRITLKGKEFISAEAVTGTKTFAQLKFQEKTEKNASGRITIHNLIHLNDPSVDFRREAALNPDGSLEITFRGTNKEAFQKNRVGYTFRLPAELVDGADYEIRPTMLKIQRGKLDLSKVKSGKSIFPDIPGEPNAAIIYLRIVKGDMKLNFDFAPVPGNARPYCNAPVTTVLRANIIKDGKDVVFGFSREKGPERYTNIVRIFCGEDDFYHYHGTTGASTWSKGPHCTNLGYGISFAGKQETWRRNSLLTGYPGWHAEYMMPFQSSEVHRELPGVLAGWRRLPSGAAHFNGGPLFPVSAGMEIPDGKEGEFVLPMPAGLYLVSLVAGDYRRETGPFTVKFNGETAFQNVRIKSGHFRQLVAYVYVRSPEKELRLTAVGKNVSLNQLIVRPDLTENMDRCFRRDLWQVRGLPEFGFRKNPADVVNMPPDSGKTVLGTEVLPEVAAVPMKFSCQKTVLPPPTGEPDPEKYPEIWNASWCDMMQVSSNSYSGFSDMSNAKFKQRFEYLRKANINGIFEEGLFWYNNFDEQAKLSHAARQRELNDLAHECGLKVIRHADNPGFQISYPGTRSISQMPGVFMNEPGTLRTVRALACLNHPEFRQKKIRDLVRYVQLTDCDVIMADDQHGTFSAYRCFCPYCRMEFTKDTGCILPMPDQVQEFYQPDNPVRARWQYWLQFQEGKFLNELRAAVKKVKPGVTFTNYGVDFRLANGHLAGIAPYLDSFGIEKARGDVGSLNYRFYFSARKLIAGLGAAWKHPTWYLFNFRADIKDSSLFNYYYWALASLVRSGTLYFTGWYDTAGSAARNRRERLDFRNKESLSDIAVFYRPDTRYNYELCRFRDSPLYEQLGISQLLSDAFIPHEFIIENSLKDSKLLRKWKLIILPDVDLMDEEELTVLREYVKEGGKLIITGRFAGLNSVFKPQKPDRFSDVTGVLHPVGTMHDTNSVLIGKKNQALNLKADSVKLKNQTASVLAVFPDGSPAVTTHRYGKGVCIVSAMAAARKNTESPHASGFAMGKKWLWKDVPEAAVLMRFLLKAAGHDRYAYTVESQVKHLLVEACRDTKTGKVYFQVLRVPRSEPKFGELTKPFATPQKKLKAADSPVIIRTRFPVKSAFADSPFDFPGKQELKVSQVPDGGSQILLPGKLLKVYNLITVSR